MLRLIPSGILNPGVRCVIGNGLVVDLQALFDEVEELRRAGISAENRLFVSDRAHVILPFHRDLDKINEASLGSRKIGTTSRGIGPAYEAKIARRGLRTCDLADAEFVEEHIRQALDTLTMLDEDAHYDWRELVAGTLALGERLQPMLTDVSVLLAGAIKAGESILFEGAQGTMLDVDHGTYPYVTSSNSTAGGACTGLGVGPGAIGAVIGIAKAYTTRVGEGPFPSELHDESGAALREKGQEFGSVTGRPRRCGWFDAVVIRHAVRVNGLDGLALTKLDVLDGLETVQICVGYRIDDASVMEFPADLRRVQRAVPVLEGMPGWKTPTAGCRDFASLPAEAKAYVARLEALTGVPVLLVSTGAAREDTAIRDDPRAIAWFGTGSSSST